MCYVRVQLGLIVDPDLHQRAHRSRCFEPCPSEGSPPGKGNRRLRFSRGMRGLPGPPTSACSSEHRSAAQISCLVPRWPLRALKKWPRLESCPSASQVSSAPISQQAPPLGCQNSTTLKNCCGSGSLLHHGAEAKTD